jgi:glycosyltransferase involved in cell wall biosynthesis
MNWLVVPIFNEASRFDAHYWNTILDNCDVSIRFVDDGSTDDSRRILQGMTHSRISVLGLSANSGKAEAIRLGFNSILNSNSSDSHFVGYIDADCAFDPTEVAGILADADQLLSSFKVDAIWMSRVKLSGYQVNRNPTRHIIGRLIATYLGRGIKFFPYDTQCGFKIFRTSFELSSSLESPFRTRWFVDLELFSRCSMNFKSWMKIREVPVVSWDEIGGSKITFKSYFSILNEIFWIRRLLVRLERGTNGPA